MLATELHGLRSFMREHGVIFAYSGYVNEKVLTGVGEAVKQKLVLEDTDVKTMRSVFAVFVEQMQNIIRYSAEKVGDDNEEANSHDLRYGVLTIGQEEDASYSIHAGNLVAKGDIDRLSTRLRDLQGMSHDELRQAYKAQLKSGPDEFSRGAGIGFIEIARRASEPLDFDFSDVDENHAFFALRARV